VSFPLIVNPAPGQQLADTIASLRQRSLLQQRAGLENRLLEQQIVSSKEASALQRDALNLRVQEAEQQRKQGEMQERDRLAGLARDNAVFQATLEQRAIENRRAEVAGKQALMRLIMQTLPEGVSLSPGRLQREAGGSRYLPGVSAPPSSLEADIQAAGGRAVPGLQGSATRQRRLGTANGVTVDPGTLSYNAPSGGAGGRVTTQDRLMQAAIGGAVEQQTLMEGLEDRNPLVAVDPNISAIIERGGRIPYIGGLIQAVGGPTAQRMRGTGRQQYQAMAGEFIHTYASSLPGRRLGPELLAVLKPNFFPPAGTTDLDVIDSYRRRRASAVERMARAAAGESVDLEGLLEDRIRAAVDRVSPREDVAEPGAVAPAAAQQDAPLGLPQILPRYQRP